MKKLPLSVLDVAPVGSGGSASEALRDSLELARLAERLGYVRYWFAEHHGMPSIASSSPEVLIAHVAAHTERMRVGSGGIMLPNHAALRIAEAFHTLEALHPGRIDLGIGRAPGADRAVTAALRPFDAEMFPEQLLELFSLSRGDFPPNHQFHGVRATPGDVRLPPVWLLGSSGASARFAGSLGLGYSFAGHFSQAPAGPPMQAYHEAFQPSETFPEPHAILALSAVCAETEERADWLAASLDLMWIRFRRGELLPLPSPGEALAYPYSAQERAYIAENRERHIVGTPETVRARIEERAQEASADEVMITTMLHAHADRLRSFELIAQAFEMT